VSKGAYMNFELITKKNNALTDGNIPNRRVTANKLLNVLNYYYEEKGSSFQISINELLKTMDMTINSGKSKEMIADAISILQQPIQIRNFTFRGKGISWISAPFLSKATILTDNKNYIKIELTEEILEGLQQRNEWTPIDLAISNQFKTKYGIVIWEMYLRYKNMPQQGQIATTELFKSLDELNKKFATNYKKPSELLRCLKRGTKEIKKITKKLIVVRYVKEKKLFRFLWEKEFDRKTCIKEFKKWVRENHTNTQLATYYLRNSYMSRDVRVAVNNSGHVVDMDEYVAFETEDAKKIWEYLFKEQDSIIAFKQGSLF